MRQPTIIVLAAMLGIVGCADDPSPGEQPAACVAAAHDAYQFPLRPGRPEWSLLTTFDEMLAATQVPADVLDSISTEGLLDTIIASPLLYVVSRAYGNLQMGFERATDSFNALSALLGRPDAGRVLLDRYRALDASAVSTAMPLDALGALDATISNVEMLLARPEILDGLDDAERAEIVAQGISKALAKGEHPDIYGFQGRATSAFAVGHALRKVAKASADPGGAWVSAFLDGQDWSSHDAIDEVLFHGQRFIAQGK